MPLHGETQTFEEGRHVFEMLAVDGFLALLRSSFKLQQRHVAHKPLEHGFHMSMATVEGFHPRFHPRHSDVVGKSVQKSGIVRQTVEFAQQRGIELVALWVRIPLFPVIYHQPVVVLYLGYSFEKRGEGSVALEFLHLVKCFS